ncbi:MAG: sulfatase [Planctomycetes bacterium]|nr:sulfatase [Planctomycetota bacterium]
MCRILLLFIVLVLSVSAFGEKPNIVFIMADDLGWMDVGYAGAEFFETPHIDKLAAQSMVFTNAYTCGPNCAPTRACLMSGTYTPRHKIYQPGGRSKGNINYMRLLVPAVARTDKKLIKKAASQFPITNSLDPKFVCIPEVLKTAGYTTARLGKWHLGDDTQGFDVSSSNGKGGPGGRFYGNINVAEQLTDRAIKFIEDNKKGPFFLYLCHWDVHTPIRARKNVVKKYKEKLDKIPQGKRQNFNPVYAGMIEAVDTSVGRVVAKIDELGLGENTLIIFISDNGGRTAVSQLAPLRGEKGSLLEGGVRVPACIRWTKTIKPKTSSDTPITSVDFLPTFASIAGAKLPTTQPVDGADISPILKGKSIPERSIFWHYPLYLSGRGFTIDLTGGRTYRWRGVPSTSMRRGDFKLIELHEDNSILLYNIKDDPGETKNLVKKMPKLAEKLLAEMDKWQKDTKAPIPTVLNPEYDLSAKASKRKTPRKRK